MKVYLDNAATTPMEPAVVETMTTVMRETHGNPSSIHNAGRKARTIIEDARKRVAQHLKASTGEIFFTSSATESNNMVLFCAVRDLGVQKIISSPTEHPCVVNSLEHINQIFGTEIDYLNVDRNGNISLDELDARLQSGSKKTMVSLMHGNNEIGTMLDFEGVSHICDKYNALFHSDAVQTVGKYDIDLSKTKVSFLSASGHKIYGPKGAGIVYINNDNQIGAFIKGGGQERQMRSGTENVYGIAGFAAALDWLVENRSMHLDHVRALRSQFKDGLEQAGIEAIFNGNQEDLYLENILSLGIPKSDKTDLIVFNLDINGICASAGSACSSGAERGSHVLDAIDSSPDHKTVRFSFSHNNRPEEISYVVQKLAEVI